MSQDKSNRQTPEYWNERYGGEDYEFGLEPNAYLRSQAHRLRPA